MLVANFVTNRPTMGSTRTYEDFSKFLGDKNSPVYTLLLNQAGTESANGKA